MKRHLYNPATRLIHTIPADPGADSNSFFQYAYGSNKGNIHSRNHQSLRTTLEQMITELENGHSGFAFASGLAAADAVIKLLQSGDEILIADDLCGDIFRLFSHVWKKFGISIRFADMTSPELVINSISARTRLIWVESPSNPTLKLTDIDQISRIADSKGCLLCVDNSFASPYLQQPLRHGADLVIHSGGMFLGGQTDLTAGLVVVKDSLLAEQIRFIQQSSGAVLSAHDCWLLIKGMETLPMRMELHCQNALKLAVFLKSHPKIDQIYYPGLSSHKNHHLVGKQSGDKGGAVLSFTLKDNTAAAAKKVVCSTNLFKLAEGIGGVVSLCCLPACMTHKNIPAGKRLQAGISDSLIRLSPGLEDVDDLIQDIDHALESERPFNSGSIFNSAIIH